jgi:glycosyltransferase involved in cell wall biosynthesis
MKVLLVHKFWKKVGGAEVYYQDTMRIIKNNGHEVMAYSTMYDPGGGKNVFDIDEQTVVMGDSPDYLKGGVISKIKNIPKTIYSTSNKKQFKNLLLKFKPDIVHVFAIYVTITPSILDACSELGVPVVMSCNDYKHICPNYRLFHHGKICEDCKGKKFYKAVTNNCCKHSLAVSFVSALEAYYHEYKNIYRKNISAFLFESKFMMDKTAEFWSSHQVKMEFLGKPFDATKYIASNVTGNYILFIGRLSDEKGVDVLLKAMQQIPEAQLKIAGGGEWSSHLKTLASNLKLTNVDFLGPVFGEPLLDLIRNCKFVVVPSLWYENFPYVMTETFALGKPIIGSDKGGIPEYIIEGKTGYTYPADDFHAMATCINKLWYDDDLVIRMGKEAKIIADKTFNDEMFYKRLMAIYNSVLGGKNKDYADKVE